MKINNYFLNNPVFLDKTILKQGTIFKGKILEIFNEEVLMEIKNQGNLRATLDTKVQISVNDEITFLVKSNQGDKIEIKAIVINDLDESNIEKGNNKNSLISKILDNIDSKILNIKDNTLSFELAKNLMENNIQLSEENLVNSIKLLDKLIELSDLDGDKKVVFLQGKNDGEKNTNNKTNLENNIKNNVNKTDSIKAETIKSELSKLAVMTPNKSHIKHLLITEKNSYSNKEDLSPMIKELLFENEAMKLEELPKIVSFIIKNNIKPSLSNFQNIKELSNNPEKFLKEFLISKENFKEFIINNMEKKDFVDRTGLLQENLEKNQNLKINGFKELEKIIEEIKEFKDYATEERINLFSNKVDFLKELNKNLSFMFIPINYKPGDLEGFVSFLKGKSKKTKSGKINVFINLDTKSLGNIKVSCELYMKNINLKMNIAKSDLELFESQENILIKKIEEIGYDLKKIDYVFNEKLKLIDQIVVNDNPTYFLDIKV